MKLDGENMNIISIAITKRIVCCICFYIFLLTDIYAQKNELSIELELVNISRSDFHPRSLKSIKNDTIPIRMTFEFLVYNKTNKLLLFGSNTQHYYRKKWDDSNYGEIGRFLMINKTDTIALFTYYGSLIPNNLRDTVAFWGSIEGVEDSRTHPVFIPFLSHWGNMGKEWINELYKYLKACRFVYVPIQADYQRRLDEFEDKSMIDSIVYPRDIIEIKKKDPFDIIISDSEEEYYIYPPISIKQDE